MPKLVVMGAKLSCNKGSKSCSLTPCEVNSVVSGPGVVATMFDHQVGDNIVDFGDCDVAPTKCKPVTPLPWAMVWTNALIGPASPITKQSKLACFKTRGAEITITYAGQETIVFDNDEWSSIDENLIEAYIEMAMAFADGDVEDAFSYLRDMRQDPNAGYDYDTNLAIAADYLRARWDTEDLGPGLELVRIQAYMTLKKSGLAPKEGPGPVSPYSRTQEKYMYKGVADEIKARPLETIPNPIKQVEKLGGEAISVIKGLL